MHSPLELKRRPFEMAPACRPAEFSTALRQRLQSLSLPTAAGTTER
jgi:hypothetical protein